MRIYLFIYAIFPSEWLHSPLSRTHSRVRAHARKDHGDVGSDIIYTNCDTKLNFQMLQSQKFRGVFLTIVSQF